MEILRLDQIKAWETLLKWLELVHWPQEAVCQVRELRSLEVKWEYSNIHLGILTLRALKSARLWAWTTTQTLRKGHSLVKTPQDPIVQADHLSPSICSLCTTRLQVKALMVSQENQSNPSNRGSFKCSHLLSLQPVLDSKINSLNPTVIIMRF